VEQTVPSVIARQEDGRKEARPLTIEELGVEGTLNTVRAGGGRGGNRGLAHEDLVVSQQVDHEADEQILNVLDKRL